MLLRFQIFLTRTDTPTPSGILGALPKKSGHPRETWNTPEELGKPSGNSGKSSGIRGHPTRTPEPSRTIPRRARNPATPSDTFGHLRKLSDGQGIRTAPNGYGFGYIVNVQKIPT